jgi:hypothetical protein
MATAKKAAVTVDDYDLKPGELTKEMVADRAGVTIRAVEIWKHEGKLPARKERRRINGVVRKQLVFQETDVDVFIGAANEPVNMPRVEKRSNQDQAMQTSGDTQKMFGFLGAMLDQMNTKIDSTPRLSRLEQLSGKMYLDIEQAATVAGIAKSKLTEAIHAAENVADPESRLQRFSGDHGRAVWRTTDLEKVIETIPPTPVVKRLPPQKQKE